MRPVPLNALTQGINHLRIKGAANPGSLYDLVNAYINQEGVPRPRPGTARVGDLAAGIIVDLGSITEGSGYTQGVYDALAMTGGSGTGATANITVNSSGDVADVVIVDGGVNYVAGDTLSAVIPGGSGFSIPVNTVSITTVGVVYFEAALHVFAAANNYGAIASPFALDVLAHPTIQNEPISKIWFAQPFMGFLYVVPEFENGDIFHYWLQSSGEWDNLTVYSPTSIVTPTSPNGFAYQALRQLPVNPSWVPNMVVATTTQEAAFTVSISGTSLTASDFTYGADTDLVAGQVIQGAGISTCTLISGSDDSWTVDVSQTVSGALATASTVTVLVPKIEPTNANGFYYVPSQIISPASPVGGQALNIATGSTEPDWSTTVNGLTDDAGDYLAYTNASITAVGGATPTDLADSITSRYGSSGAIAGLTQVATVTNQASTLPLTIGALAPWSAGKVYQLGSVVTPTTTQGAFALAIPDGDFSEDDPTDYWTTGGSGTAWEFEETAGVTGVGCAYNPPGATEATITSQLSGTGPDGEASVSPGEPVTASAYFSYSGSSAPGADFVFSMYINWYDQNASLISQTGGDTVTQPPGGGGFVKASVTGNAPAGTYQAAIEFKGLSGTSDRGTASVSQVSWSLTVASAATLLVYQAVAINDEDDPATGQVLQGTSGGTEPVWPTQVSGEVTDGQVTWAAVGSSIIVWEAYPIMYSGAAEPTWPTVVGGVVWDGSTSPASGGFVWECISRQITDPNCPNTKYVATGASHIFCGDNDVVAYCAAVNPTDWSSTNNAGYLPTGLQNYGSNPVAVLGLYRSNLMVFNSGGYQMWQIDPDPQNMALLDAQPIGTTYTRGAQTIGQDQVITTPLGVRNVGMTGATVNMQTGSFGQPIDDLIQAQINAGTYQPLALYYPARGQYWVIFGPQAFVGTQNQPGQIQWSRYLFPDVITDWTLWGDDLYLRSAGGLVWMVDPTLFSDDVQSGTVEVSTISPSDGFAAAANVTGLTDDNYPVTFTSYEGLPIPTPLALNTTFYVRDIVGSGPATVGIAATSGGDIIASYANGFATMNWTVAGTMTVSSAAGSPGEFTIYGDAFIEVNDVMSVSMQPGQPLPLAVGDYWVVSVSFNSGDLTTTVQLSATEEGDPAFLSSGQCVLTDLSGEGAAGPLVGAYYDRLASPSPGNVYFVFSGDWAAATVGQIYTDGPRGDQTWDTASESFSITYDSAVNATYFSWVTNSSPFTAGDDTTITAQVGPLDVVVTAATGGSGSLTATGYAQGGISFVPTTFGSFAGIEYIQYAQYVATASPGYYGYLIASGFGGAVPVGTSFTVTENGSADIPSPLATGVTYVVTALDATNTNMYVSQEGTEQDISSASTCIMSYNLAYTSELQTFSGVAGYIRLGVSSTAPVLGDTVQFSEFDGGSIPAPFVADTNYVISSIVPPTIGQNFYQLQVTQNGVPIVVSVAGNMNMTGPSGYTTFDSIVWWPWLDCGTPGIDKMVEAFHIAGSGDAQVSFGWDSNDLTAFTPLYDLDIGDTVPGFPIGLGVMSKAISPYVYFAGPQNWTLESLILYVTELKLS